MFIRTEQHIVHQNRTTHRSSEQNNTSINQSINIRLIRWNDKLPQLSQLQKWFT